MSELIRHRDWNEDLTWSQVIIDFKEKAFRIVDISSFEDIFEYYIQNYWITNKSTSSTRIICWLLPQLIGQDKQIKALFEAEGSYEIMLEIMRRNKEYWIELWNIINAKHSERDKRVAEYYADPSNNPYTSEGRALRSATSWLFDEGSYPEIRKEPHF